MPLLMLKNKLGLGSLGQGKQTDQELWDQIYYVESIPEIEFNQIALF